MLNKPILLSSEHKRQLLKTALITALLLPVALIGTLAISAMVDMDLYLTSQIAGVLSILILITAVLSNLRLGDTMEQKYKGFVIYWFCFACLMNVIWQIPLDLFTDSLLATPVNRENMWWAIYWWSYTLSDLDYLNIYPYVFAIELWWFLGNLLAVYGLYLLHKQRHVLGYIYLGVAGTFEAYNASLYILTNGIDGAYHNIWESPAALAPGGTEALAWFIYIAYNGFWCLSGGMAGIFSFYLLTRIAESNKTLGAAKQLSP